MQTSAIRGIRLIEASTRLTIWPTAEADEVLVAPVACFPAMQRFCEDIPSLDVGAGAAPLVALAQPGPVAVIAVDRARFHAARHVLLVPQARMFLIFFTAQSPQSFNKNMKNQNIDKKFGTFSSAILLFESKQPSVCMAYCRLRAGRTPPDRSVHRAPARSSRTFNKPSCRLCCRLCSDQYRWSCC